MHDQSEHSIAGWEEKYSLLHEEGGNDRQNCLSVEKLEHDTEIVICREAIHGVRTWNGHLNIVQLELLQKSI